MEENVNFDVEPQSQLIYNKSLPYCYDGIKDEATLQLRDIKEYLSKAVILNDIVPGAVYWSSKLYGFINLYGYYFSKEDHVNFVKLVYHLTVANEGEISIVIRFAQLLSFLLKKRVLLSPDDLTLPWRPLYNLYNKIFCASSHVVGIPPLPINAEVVVKSAIRCCRTYFPPSATAEMLDEWRPRLCPFDVSVNRAISYSELFLPTLLKEGEVICPYNVWFNEYLDIWKRLYSESNTILFWLFARLSWQNIGYIDWEEHLPFIFTRILRAFNLPVHYKKVQLPANWKYNKTSVCMFIVANLGGGSSTQYHLEKLFKVFESYYHPSNNGPWTIVLAEFLNKLTSYFVQRLHRERHMKKNWERLVLESKKLTESDINAFVKCVKAPALLAMFSKMGSQDAAVVFHRLSLLRPELVIPSLLDELYRSLEMTLEPHRLIATLHCVVSVARPLVSANKWYPEGKQHVIPLLLSSLPGIDPNDINKCMVTFQFIATFLAMVPVVDCSAAVDQVPDLTPIEQDVCLQTAGFEDFVIQFMNRAFTLIENSTFEHSTRLDRETDSMNREENMIEMGLSSTFKAILNEAHPKIFEVAIQKLKSYVLGRCVEAKVAGQYLGAMCRSATRVNPQVALEALIPGICKILISFLDDAEMQHEDNLGNEILFNLLLLFEILQCSGFHLVPYLPQITKVLDLSLHLKCREGYRFASSVLSNLLGSLNQTMPKECRSVIESWDMPFTDYLPIRNWGKSGDIHNLNLHWNEPNEVENSASREVVLKYLTPELIKLRKMARGELTLERDEFHQSLCITQAVMHASASLPIWDEEPIILFEMSVPRRQYDIRIRSKPFAIELEHRDLKKNVRLAIAETLIDLVDFLLKVESDDTRALSNIATIYYLLIFYHGIKKDEFDIRWRNYRSVKGALANSIVKNRKHIRYLLIERTLLQHERRLYGGTKLVITNTHRKIMESLFKLSISQYSEVRKKAQMTLEMMCFQFKQSWKLILPNVIEVLKSDTGENHKKYKGCLYIIKKLTMAPCEIEPVKALWPALIASQYSEKFSVTQLMDGISESLYRYLECFTFFLKNSNEVKDIAWVLLNSSSAPVVGDNIVDSSLIAESLEASRKREDNSLREYHELVEQIANCLNSGELHWRQYYLGLKMLGILIFMKIKYPAVAVETIIKNLIHDNIYIRKRALHYAGCILKVQKRKHVLIKVDPYSIQGNHPVPQKPQPGDNRPDNRWLQYHPDSENDIYVHKTWCGWYTWSQPFEVYAPYKDQPQLKRAREELSEEEVPIYDFFNDESNINKLVALYSADGDKSNNHFRMKKFSLFKGLFRNFGDTFFPLFKEHLLRLASDTQDSSQRFLAELVAGLMRATKHWDGESRDSLQKFVVSLIGTVLSKLKVDTIRNWEDSLMHMGRDRDPNQLKLLIEFLLADPLNEKDGSFTASNRLRLLMAVFNQQEWRIANCAHRLLSYLQPFMSHPYKSFRDEIGVALFSIFRVNDFVLPNGTNSQYPKCLDFVDSLIPQLTIIINEPTSSSTANISTSTPVLPEALVKSGFLTAKETVELQKCDVETVAIVSSRLQGTGANEPEFLDGSLETMSLSDSADVESDAASSLNIKVPFVSFNLAEGFLPGGSEERKSAFRLMNTVCQWIIRMGSYPLVFSFSDLYRFLPHLCHLESIDSDQELRSNCITALTCMTHQIVFPDILVELLNMISNVSSAGWWRARAAVLQALQVIVFNNFFTLLANSEAQKQVCDLVLGLLHDPRLEVRETASLVLGGLIYCNFITADEAMLNVFIKKLNSVSKQKSGKPMNPAQLLERHEGALGLSAFVNAFPYDVPDGLPEILIILGDHINDPQPISTTIKKTLSNFRRTHHDNWLDHKRKFTGDQISVLADLLVSPSYYA